MPVSELLARTSSYELTEWMAYENAFGPLGPEYRDDMLASIHEQLQALRHLMGELWTEKDNPIPVPKKLPRPNDLWQQASADDEDDPDVVSSIAEFDRNFD